MRVENIRNEKGNKVKNQFLIEDGGTYTFQSYDSTIAKTDRRTYIKIFSDWDYSKTTTKHFYNFLREINMSILANRKQVIKGLENGYIKEYGKDFRIIKG